MSADEALSWQAWLRRNPRGYVWENWMQATLHRALVIVGRGGNSKGVRPVSDFLHRPPEPLLATRLRREAAERKGKRKKAPKNGTR